MTQEKTFSISSGHYQLPYHFGLGGVPIGNEFSAVTDTEAEQTKARLTNPNKITPPLKPVDSAFCCLHNAQSSSSPGVGGIFIATVKNAANRVRKC